MFHIFLQKSFDSAFCTKNTRHCCYLCRVFCVVKNYMTQRYYGGFVRNDNLCVNNFETQNLLSKINYIYWFSKPLDFEPSASSEISNTPLYSFSKA